MHRSTVSYIKIIVKSSLLSYEFVVLHLTLYFLTMWSLYSEYGIINFLLSVNVCYTGKQVLLDIVQN